MRTVDVRCDHCGAHRDEVWERRATAARAAALASGSTEKEAEIAAQVACVWWLLEEHSRSLRTGPLDFCSLICLGIFCAADNVRDAYRADFTEGRA